MSHQDMAVTPISSPAYRGSGLGKRYQRREKYIQFDRLLLVFPTRKAKTLRPPGLDMTNQITAVPQERKDRSSSPTAREEESATETGPPILKSTSSSMPPPGLSQGIERKTSSSHPTPLAALPHPHHHPSPQDEIASRPSGPGSGANQPASQLEPRFCGSLACWLARSLASTAPGLPFPLPLLRMHSFMHALMSDGPSRDRRAGDATLIRSERGNQDKSRSVRRFGDAAWCGARVQRCRKLNRTPLHPSIHPSIPDDNMIPAAMSVRSLARSLVSSSKVTGWKTYVRERPCFAQMRPDAAKATSAKQAARTHVRRRAWAARKASKKKKAIMPNTHPSQSVLSPEKKQRGREVGRWRR
ncbi:hypothetical protein BKA81DRAFT_378016 [Phyllosticta paracitricarpa]|uniref:Uncharacterized protein n=1 Tax=Phyllosticta citricarpa TaxID=55181 RepID=A0ABR1MLL6_9PEZI